MSEFDTSPFASPEEIAEIMATENREADEFFRDLGQIPRSEYCVIMREALQTQEEQDHYVELERSLETVEERLRSLPEVQRLHQLRQLGSKTIPYQDIASAGMEQHARRPALHSRFQHSELIAELAKVAAARLGLSGEQAASMVAAAYLHDIGHSAFSHVGDDLVVEKTGRDHELRTIEMVRDSSDIQSAFEAGGVDTKEVSALIKEKGPLGSLQSVLDTLSYLILDTAAIQDSQVEKYGAEYLADIEGIDAESGLLILQTPELWQQFLEIRAAMMQKVYLSPQHRFEAGARVQIMKIAIDKGYLAIDEVIHGADDMLHLKLQSLVQEDRGAAMMSGRMDDTPYLSDCQDLFVACMEFYDPKEWDRRQYATQAEVDEFLSRSVKMGTEEKMKRVFVVAPFDYTKKTVRFMSIKNGVKEKHTIQARKTTLREDEKMWTVYMPKK